MNGLTILEDTARDFDRRARELKSWGETPVQCDAETGQTRELDEIDAEKWETARGCAITALELMAQKLRAIDKRLKK